MTDAVQEMEHACESTGMRVGVKRQVVRKWDRFFLLPSGRMTSMEMHNNQEGWFAPLCGRRACVLFISFLVMSSTVAAEGWEFGGHLKYQLSVTNFSSRDVAALYGDDPARDQALEGRLKGEWRGSGWDFAAHYEVLTLSGDSVETRRALSVAGLLIDRTGLPDDRTRLFDLSDDFIDRPRTAAVQRLDRLSLGYTSGNATLRLGRQAMSWGNGLAFQVFDFVNPFSPIAIDKDYKTGEDMLYGQWQWTGQGDAQLLLLPRRDPFTRRLDHERASQALKLHTRAVGFDIDVLGARHYDQSLLGVGVVRNVGGAVWRWDILHIDIPGRDAVWSQVSNLDYSWTIFGKNVYSFVEYFRNGLGVYRNSEYLGMDPELTARVTRGELYALGRDSLIVGMQVEASPLVNAFFNLLQNLNDASRLAQLRVVYDWRQNLQGQVGINFPQGERGTEYGGVPIGPSGPYLGAGNSVYARLAYYF